MAYGSTTDFTATRDEIIKGAMRLCGVLDSGETPKATDVTDAAEALNMMVKTWVADGIHLWTVSEAHLFLEEGKSFYNLGGTSGDHVAYSPVFTWLSADGASGATSVSFAGTSSISVSDNAGIVLDDGEIHWTTITAISGTTVTLDDGLASAASSGNAIYTYTNPIERPLQIFSARLVLDEFEGTEIPLTRMSEEEYKSIPNKYIEGRPTAFWYDPLLGDYGKIYLWPVPDSVNDFVKFSYQFPFYDFDSATDNPHFPAEWLEVLKFSLAVRIAPEYGVTMEDRMWLKQEAQELLDKLLAWDREHTSVFIQPDVRR